MLMGKFVLRGAWLSTFSRDAMRILCLSLAGRWWRTEWETGQLLGANLTFYLALDLLLS